MLSTEEYRDPTSNTNVTATLTPPIASAPPDQFEVIIPSDMLSGDMMSAIADDGKLYQFIVPNNVVAGQGVMMQIPQVKPPEYDLAASAPIQEQLLNDMYPVEEEIPIVEVIPCPVVVVKPVVTSNEGVGRGGGGVCMYM